MDQGAYVRMVQRQTYAENIERALRLNQYDWDIQDFVYHEKHVEGIYSYVDKYYDDDIDNLSAYYEACLSFMKQGHLPKEIREKTLRYHWAFGPSEFFDKDVEKLNAWATSIQILDFKLRHNQDFMEKYFKPRELNPEDLEEGGDDSTYYRDMEHNEKIERDQAMFNELVSLCAQIKELFIPMGRPLRYPKLFSEI